VKQIYYGNLGWYEGDPAFLLPVSMNERSQKIIEPKVITDLNQKVACLLPTGFYFK